MAAAQTDLSIKENEQLSPDFANGPPLPIDDWPDNPLLLCVHPRHKSFIHTNYDDQIAIPFNKVFDLESKAFKGKAILRVIDMPTTDKSYFKGRRRKTDFTSQGVFKRRIRFDHVFTGQIYDRPFRHLPTPYLISTGLKIVQALAPSLKADIDCDNPHLMSPWASACQVFNICKPGDEVPLPAEPSENLELLDSKFKGMSFTDRKALFHDFNELSKYYFEPGYVYTMSFYTHMFSPMQYCLHMLKMKWGIQSYMPCPMVANAIILPEDDDVAMISDSCDKLIGDTKINDKLIEEILKEKSASVDNDNDNDNDSGNNSNSKIENDKINKNANTNTNTNTNDKNEKNNTNKVSNDDNNKSNKNKNNNNDNDSNGTSSDDIPNPGRDRNPAVDNNTQESNDDKNKNKDKEQTNNNNNNTENSNNNSNNNEKDNNSDTDEKKGNHHKSVSEMTIDEKIDVMQSDSRDLLDCDMIYSFNIWHVKLVDELYNGKYSIHQKGTNSNSNSNDNNNNNNNDNSGKTRSESFSLFGSKKKSSMDNNTGQSKSHDLPNSGNNGNSGNGSENVDDNNSNDTSDGSKSKSILGSMFGKRWS